MKILNLFIHKKMKLDSIPHLQKSKMQSIQKTLV